MKLPIGISDFKELVEDNYTLIDKSLFIKDIIDDGAKIILITRPRRFGKTLNMSMLNYYFDSIDTSAQPYFEPLNIWETGARYQNERGKYPVIFISFKDIKNQAYDSACADLAALLSYLYLEHDYLLDSPKLKEQEKTIFLTIIEKKANPADLKLALKRLTEYLYRFHDVKPILLIDEYDHPIHASFVHGYYDDMIELMRGLLGSVLKDNTFLYKGILTGILRVAKESIFSGINNLRVYPINSRQYEQYFGFTEDETLSLLTEAGATPEQKELTKQWYNGYTFGDAILYNPWSILNCIADKFSFQPYWVNTSDNALVAQLLRKGSLYFQTQLEKILQDELVEETIEDYIILKDLATRREVVWTLLVYSGYLKVTSTRTVADEIRSAISIPNKEIKRLLSNLVKRWFPSNIVNSYHPTIDALLEGNIPAFQRGLSQYLIQTFSYFDATEKTGEEIYHAFVLGFVAMLSQDYMVRSNREAGFGRYDVIIIPKDKNKLGILFEFKALEKNASEKKLKTEAQKALSQIQDKSYHIEFQQMGIQRLLQLGIAFAGKQVEMLSEEISLEP